MKKWVVHLVCELCGTVRVKEITPGDDAHKAYEMLQEEQCSKSNCCGLMKKTFDLVEEDG